MHNYNYVNTLWFGTVSFDSCSRFYVMPVLFVYYVYENPTYEVANKLICILYLVSCTHLRVSCLYEIIVYNVLNI